MPDDQCALAVKSMKVSEQHMINLLRDRCGALMAERRIRQEKRAEFNYSIILFLTVKQDETCMTFLCMMAWLLVILFLTMVTVILWKEQSLLISGLQLVCFYAVSFSLQ